MTYVKDVGVRIVVYGVGQALRDATSAQRAVDGITRSVKEAESMSRRLGTTFTKLGNDMTQLGRTMTYTVTLPIVAALGALVGSGINFEDAFAGVAKTVEGVAKGFDYIAKEMYGTADGLSAAQKQAVFANETFGDLTDKGKEIRNDFIQLSTTIPIAAVELARIGQVAGQLGISANQITDFTETIALLGVTTDLTSEEAAYSIARLGNIMGVEMENMAAWAKQAADAIVHLGNNAAATEPEIVQLAYRIAGAGRAVGLTMQEILGISASLAEAGIKAELGGSAVSRILLTMSYAANDFSQSFGTFRKQVDLVEEQMNDLRKCIESGNYSFDELMVGFKDSELVLTGLKTDLAKVEKGTLSLDDALNNVRSKTLAGLEKDLAKSQETFKVMAQIVGMTEQELVKLIRADPTRAFQLLIAGLAEAQAQGTLTSKTLTDLELNTIRLKDVMNRLGPNQELITENIKLANDAWSEGIALQEEATKQFKTIKNQLQLLKNAFVALGISIFDVVRDDLAFLINKLIQAMNAFRKLDDGIKKLIVRFGVLAAALGPGLIVFGTLFKILGKVFFGVDIVEKGFRSLIKLPFNKLTSLLSIFSGVGKLGGVATGILGTLGKALTSPFGLVGTVAGKLFGLNFGGAFIEEIAKRLVYLKNKTLDTLMDLFNWTLDVRTRLAPIENTITKIASPLGDVVMGFVEGMSYGFKYLLFNAKQTFSGVFNWAGKLSQSFSTFFSTLFNWAGKLGQLFSTFIVGPFSIIFGFVGDIAGTLTRILGWAFQKLLKIVGAFGKTALGWLGKIMGAVGSLTSKILGLVPVLGKFLFSGILGFFTKLPALFALVGAGFAAVFAPKVIKNAIKNWDAVLGQLKLSFRQFGDDLKKSGLEKAILLFFGGGSMGSGREGGLLGIARALGASEESAKKFSYAMGTAAYWVIQIVKSFGELGRRMAVVITGGNAIAQGAQTTSDRIVSLSAAIAKFFEGFFVGWTSQFDGIIAVFGVFVDQVRASFDAFGNLFDAVFGTATKEAQGTLNDFYASLEPGVESTASRLGATVGTVMGQLVIFGIQALTLIAKVVEAIANALTRLVQAYKEGGAAGVIAEIGNVFADAWVAFVEGAGTLWERIKPKLSTFLTEFGNWAITEGLPAVASAASTIFGAIGSTLSQALFGGTRNLYTAFEPRQVGPAIGPGRQLTGEAPREAFKDIEQTLGLNVMLVKTGEEQFPGVLEMVANLIDNIADFLGKEDTAAKVVGGFVAIFEAVKTLVSNIWRAGGAGGGIGLGQSFVNLAVSIGEFFVNAWNGIEGKKGIKHYFKELLKLLADWLGQAWDIIQPGIETLLTEAWNWIKTDGWPILCGMGKDAAKAVLEGIKEEFGKTTVGQLFISEGAKEGFGEAAKDFWGDQIVLSEEDKQALIKESETSGFEISDSLMRGLESGILEKEDLTELAMWRVVDRGVKNILEKYMIESPSQIMKGYGQDFMQGFIDGLLAKVSLTRDSFMRVINNAVTFFLQTYQMLSPSLVMQRHGEDLMQGLINGIVNKYQLLSLAMQGAVNIVMINVNQILMLQNQAYNALLNITNYAAQAINTMSQIPNPNTLGAQMANIQNVNTFSPTIYGSPVTQPNQLGNMLANLYTGMVT